MDESPCACRDSAAHLQGSDEDATSSLKNVFVCPVRVLFLHSHGEDVVPTEEEDAES